MTLYIYNMMMLSNKLPEDPDHPPKQWTTGYCFVVQQDLPKNMLGLKSEIIWCLRIGQKGNVKKVFDKFDPYHPIVLGVNDFDIS